VGFAQISFWELSSRHSGQQFVGGWCLIGISSTHAPFTHRIVLPLSMIERWSVIGAELVLADPALSR